MQVQVRAGTGEALERLEAVGIDNGIARPMTTYDNQPLRSTSAARCSTTESRTSTSRDTIPTRTVPPRAHRAFIERELEAVEGAGERVVVITHHAPSPKSIRIWYESDPYNCAFASNLDRAIERYQPALWIHGRMHDPVDERQGLTRLVANPAGYAYEAKKRFDPGLCVEIDETRRDSASQGPKNAPNLQPAEDVLRRRVIRDCLSGSRKNRRSTPSGKHPTESVDAVGALELAHEGDDLRNVLSRKTRDGRHVTETPVMTHDALLDGPVEARVRMVTRLVDLVKKGRAPFGAGRVLAVANGAVRGEEAGTRPCLGRELGNDGGVGRRSMKPPCAGPGERCGEHGRARGEPSRPRTSPRALARDAPGLFLALTLRTAHLPAARECARFVDPVRVTPPPFAGAGSRAGTLAPTP